MLRSLIYCVMLIGGHSATTVAGDHFYFPDHVFASPPVVYAAPVVSYQPAWIVPTSYMVVPTYVVPTVPVSTVSYSTQYYAPLVPTVSTMPYISVPHIATVGYYAPQRPVVASAVFAPAVSWRYHGRRYHGRRFR